MDTTLLLRDESAECLPYAMTSVDCGVSGKNISFFKDGDVHSTKQVFDSSFKISVKCCSLLVLLSLSRFLIAARSNCFLLFSQNVEAVISLSKKKTKQNKKGAHSYSHTRQSILSSCSFSSCPPAMVPRSLHRV